MGGSISGFLVARKGAEALYNIPGGHCLPNVLFTVSDRNRPDRKIPQSPNPGIPQRKRSLIVQRLNRENLRRRRIWRIEKVHFNQTTTGRRQG